MGYLSLIALACSHGHLRSSLQFDEAKVLFPPNYTACDNGDAEACSRLAFEMADWSDNIRTAVIADLHRLACEGNVPASCVELAIRNFKHNPAAATTLAAHCQRESSLRACDVLARAGDRSAALQACKLGSEQACIVVERLSRTGAAVGEVGALFMTLCSQGRGDACLRAAHWVTDWGAASHAADSSLALLGKSCDAGHHPGCFQLDLAVVDQVVARGVTDECTAFATALTRACNEFSRCRSHRFCMALTDDPRARSLLDGACRTEPQGTDCALFLQLPTIKP